jgi:DNA repair exonuclease SbcCD nuclease subunit
MNKKIALISDLHMGISRNSSIFEESQLKFLYEEFLVYIEKNNIDTILVLGDVFDNRNNISVKIYDSVYKFFDRMSNFKIYILLGNHDVFYNTSTDINSLKMLSKFKNIHLIEQIEKIKIYDRDFLFVPWQIDNDAFVEKIKNYTAEICCGHFDILHFWYNKFKECEAGLMKEIFYDRFKVVYSGHFHSRSNQNNIYYIGCPFQLTRADSGEEKGFVVLDTETLIHEYINNTKSFKFISIKYPEIVKEELIKGNICDIQLTYNENYDDLKVNEYIEKIEKFKPIEIQKKIINNFLTPEIEKEIEENKVKTIEELIVEYVKTVPNIDNSKIENELMNLFKECSKGEN